MITLLVRLSALLLAFASSLSAAIKVGTLNCFFLVDPSRPAEGQLSSKTPVAEIYLAKVENLAGLIGGLDVVGIQEVGSELEAAALANKAGYQARFTQGRDTYTGQDVATLVMPRKGLVVRSASRVRELEGLSKHLLLILEDAGTRYAVLNVHLIRPMGRSAEKHADQLDAIKAWVASVKSREPATVVVVLGDFNDSSRNLLPLTDSAVLTDFASTHLDKRPFDRIFTTGSMSGVAIVRPPYPKRPNDILKATWSDHYFLRGVISP